LKQNNAKMEAFDINIASYSREKSYHKEHNIREYTRAVTK